MKLPSKYIALLVILSLTGIFAYQAYWLTGLYQTMRSDIDRSIVEAMRTHFSNILSNLTASSTPAACMYLSPSYGENSRTTTASASSMCGG